MARSNSILSLLCACLAIAGLSACANATNENAPDSTAASSVISKPIELADDSSITQVNIQSPQPAEPLDLTQDTTGIPSTDAALAVLLHTGFRVDESQVIPTTGWICSDVFEQKRIYYFYPSGLLNDTRSVAVERTLTVGGNFEDLTFFWSVSSSDSILMSSVISDEQGNLLSSGKQYDMNSIRFTVVDNVRTFTAQSLLRGKLVCAAFNLN